MYRVSEVPSPRGHRTVYQAEGLLVNLACGVERTPSTACCNRGWLPELTFEGRGGHAGAQLVCTRTNQSGAKDLSLLLFAYLLSCKDGEGFVSMWSAEWCTATQDPIRNRLSRHKMYSTSLLAS